jgi:(2R)-ethylmalonyl-CoA mutase
MATEKDRPWVMRTYAGHSSAAESNALFRRNLAKGQTGLSVAFDLPTQTGYDADHPLAKGEVGKVGVPIAHLGDMRALFDQIPLAQMNTSMTINATAMWLLALYQVAAQEQGALPDELTGTTQNDIVKEYLSRGTYAFPPDASLRLTTDLIAYTVANVPKWNPINICRRRSRNSPARCRPRSPSWTGSATAARCRRSGSATWCSGSRSS